MLVKDEGKIPSTGYVMTQLLNELKHYKIHNKL